MMYELKTDQLSLKYYLHKLPDYRHTDKVHGLMVH